MQAVTALPISSPSVAGSPHQHVIEASQVRHPSVISFYKYASYKRPLVFTAWHTAFLVLRGYGDRKSQHPIFKGAATNAHINGAGDPKEAKSHPLASKWETLTMKVSVHALQYNSVATCATSSPPVVPQQVAQIVSGHTRSECTDTYQMYKEKEEQRAHLQSNGNSKWRRAPCMQTHPVKHL
eukprot:1157511-Pelagomonas_calceolata.AAC.3